MAKPLSSLPLVCVVWWDAHCDATTSFEIDAAIRDMHKVHVYYSWGLLVKEDQEGVTLAMDECVTDPSVRTTSFIPRALVREVVNFGRLRRRRHAPPLPPAPSPHPPA